MATGAKLGQIQAPIRPMMGYNKRQAFKGPLTDDATRR